LPHLAGVHHVDVESQCLQCKHGNFVADIPADDMALHGQDSHTFSRSSLLRAAHGWQVGGRCSTPATTPAALSSALPFVGWNIRFWREI
jgi:hypothetical protein